ncbi:protein C3orf33-like [Amphiura filiformis]|uniref:protein C3orf33-like n=1 Tax=Amphiura filiformis TaxID=82378 RepID=UPI003B228E4B
MSRKSQLLLHNDDAQKSRSISYQFQAGTHFIDQHLQLFRTGSTVLACVGLLYVARSIRMYKKFHHVRDIPQEFVRKHVRLRGQVISVEKSHLKLEHLPIIELPKFVTRIVPDKVAGLNVNLAGVLLLEESQEFLQKQVPVGQVLWFQMLGVDEENQEIQAVVTFKQNWRKTTNLNELVLRHGYGKVKALPEHTNRKIGVKLTQRLIKAEIAAEKAHQGVWHEEETQLDRLKGVMYTSWNGMVYVVKGVVGVGVKIVRAPVTGYRAVRQIFGKFKKR